jgi:hypothetical protein
MSRSTPEWEYVDCPQTTSDGWEESGRQYRLSCGRMQGRSIVKEMLDKMNEKDREWAVTGQIVKECWMCASDCKADKVCGLFKTKEMKGAIKFEGAINYRDMGNLADYVEAQNEMRRRGYNPERVVVNSVPEGFAHNRYPNPNEEVTQVLGMDIAVLHSVGENEVMIRDEEGVTRIITQTRNDNETELLTAHREAIQRIRERDGND